MAELIAVTTITGTEQIINLDYVIQIEPHNGGSLISMASDDLNQLIVEDSPYEIANRLRSFPAPLPAPHAHAPEQ